MVPEDIFSRSARRSRALRSLQSPEEDRWLVRRMEEDLVERLDAVTRPLHSILVVGLPGPGLIDALQRRGISVTVAGLAGPRAHLLCEEDGFPVATESFDAILSVGGLDTVNDLPGALILIRKALKPGGIFIGAMLGAGSLPSLRMTLARVETRAVARIHPLVDVRAAGDLLVRAGFGLPVADLDTVTARYATLASLTRDLRANGLSNAMIARQPLSGRTWAEVEASFPRDGDGRLVEQFGLLCLTGWSPMQAAPGAA